MPADFNPISEPSSSDSKPSEMDNPSPEDSQGGKPKMEPWKLTPEQEEDAGMEDAQPGETWTFTTTATKTEDGWMPKALMNGRMAGPDKTEDSGDDDDGKPVPTVRSPSDMGMKDMM